MLRQNSETRADHSSQPRPSVLSQSLLTQQERKLKSLKRAESLAKTARDSAKSSYIKTKRRLMSAAALPNDPDRDQQIKSLSSESLTHVLKGMLHLIKWVTEDVESDVLQSRIATLIEAGVTRQVYKILRFEVEMFETMSMQMYDRDGLSLEGPFELLKLVQEHSCRLLFGLSLGNQHQLMIFHRHSLTEQLMR